MTSTETSTVATPSESRAEVLRLTGRNYGVVRHLLVQHPRGSASRPSTLGALVHTRKHRALLLYLLLLTIWPMLAKRRGSTAIWRSWMTALRRWLHAGGRLWIMLDRTDPVRLFGIDCKNSTT